MDNSKYSIRIWADGKPLGNGDQYGKLALVQCSTLLYMLKIDQDDLVQHYYRQIFTMLYFIFTVL